MPAGLPNDYTGCGAQEDPAARLGRRSCLPGRVTLIVLESIVASRPVLLAMALPVYKTAVVNLSGNAASGLGRRSCLPGRVTLIVLESIVASRPVLLAMALPVYKTAVVDVLRAPPKAAAKSRIAVAIHANVFAFIVRLLIVFFNEPRLLK